MSRSAQHGKKKKLSSSTLPLVFSFFYTFYSGSIIINSNIIIIISIIFIFITIIIIITIFIIIFTSNLIIPPRLVGTEHFLGFCFELNSVMSQLTSNKFQLNLFLDIFYEIKKHINMKYINILVELG